MKIGIMAAGNIGAALAKRFVELGHDVSVANSAGPETLRDLQKETSATAVTPAPTMGGMALATSPL